MPTDEDREIERLIERFEAASISFTQAERELRLRRYELSLAVQTQQRRVQSRTREARSPRQSQLNKTTRGNEYKPGDRIFIGTNTPPPISKAERKRRRANSKDRTATVTKVRAGRIDFRTDNGHETWRAPHNVKRLVVH